MAGFYGFSAVPTDQSPALIGQVTWGANGTTGALITATNVDDQALDKWTMTVSSTGPTTVSYTYQGITYTDTIAAAATAQGVIDNLSALSGTVVLLQIADLVATGATTWTATGKALGVSFTMVATTNQAVSHTTTGALGSDIPQGRAVMSIAVGTQPGVIGTLLAKAVDNLAVQVLTLSPVYGASSSYDVTVRLYAYKNGITQDIPCGVILADTNTATDCTAVAAAINAAMPAATVIADGTSGTTVVCTSEVKGLAFDVIVEISGGTATCARAYTTGAVGDDSTDLNAAFIGFVPHSGRIVQDSSGNPVWQVGTPGPVASIGAYKITVEDPASESPSRGTSLWIRTAANGTLDKIGSVQYAAGAGLAPLSREKGFAEFTDTNGGVHLYINPNNS